MIRYLAQHAQSLISTVGRLARSPGPTLLTVAVLGIALALPAGLFVALQALAALGSGFDGQAQMSVFFHRDASSQETAALVGWIGEQPAVGRVEFLPADEALDEFRSWSGLGAAIDALGANPLPAVAIVHPRSSAPEALDVLAAAIGASALVDVVQLDMEWLLRLDAIVRLGERVVWILSVLLGLAAVLIISNTVRLGVLDRRHEIEVINMVGGSDGFVRRPFLYLGLLLGAGGAVAGWLIVVVCLELVETPFGELTALYDSPFTLSGLGLRRSLWLVVGAGAVGWLAARVTVGRQLRALRRM